MEYRFVIIEDNPGAARSLEILMSTYESYKIAGMAASLQEGISLVLSTRPHLIFLDVELGEENGFNLINQLKHYMTDLPPIIMTTGHEKYAKTALNHDALYFLDKPICPDELQLALAKFEKLFRENHKHITIKNSEGHYILFLCEIEYISSNGSCCKVYRKGQKPLLITKSLKELETKLPSQFARVHKGYIVNADRVEMINTNKKIIRLKKDSLEEISQEIPIGASYLDRIKCLLLRDNV